MKIEVTIQEADDSAPHERESVTIETHALRGETYVVLRSDTVLEGESKVFNITNGARIIVTSPKQAELVFDKEQGAAVRVQNQENTEGRADKPDPKAAEAEAAKKAAEERVKAQHEAAAKAAAEAKAKQEAEAKEKQEAEAKTQVDAQAKAPTEAKATPSNKS